MIGTMHRRAFFTLLAIFAGVSGALAVLPDEAAPSFMNQVPALGQRTPSIAAATARIEAADGVAGVSVRWSRRTWTPSLVTFAEEGTAQSAPRLDGLDPAAAATAAVAGLAPLYGIRDAATELAAGATSVDGYGYQHVVLRQQLNGLPVMGGTLRVHFRPDGRVSAINGNFIPDLDIETDPSISGDDAAAVVLADLQSADWAGGDLVEGPSLVVFALGSQPCLAYAVVVNFDLALDKPGLWRYWVDAKDGAILLRYNDIQSISPPSLNGVHGPVTGTVLDGEGSNTVTLTGWQEDNGISYLWNKTNTWYVYNIGDTGADAHDYAHRFTNDWQKTDQTEMSAAAAFSAIGVYYRSVHGRAGHDDMDSYAIANVHYLTDLVNAYYSPFFDQFYFGDGDGVVADELAVMDVAAHEYQHGVTRHTADLIYYAESGALNESVSDIFGALVEFHAQPDGRSAYPGRLAGHSDWLMGEDCWLSDVALRDMRDPQRFGQPSYYKGTLWYDGPFDNGGVHYNNGVQNFFFYLLCEGGVGNNDGADYDVAGIGIDSAARVAYLALTDYMTPETDYEAARAAWLGAATELDELGLTTNAAGTVVLAWAACGVGRFVIVSPEGGYAVGGEPGAGPYLASNKTYKVIHPSVTSALWSVTVDVPWLQIDNPSFSFSSLDLEGTSVVVSVDQTVAAMKPVGVYTGFVQFANLTTGRGDATRLAILRIDYNYAIRSTAFSWVEHPSSGLFRIFTRNGVSGPLLAPFQLSLYGKAYDMFYVSANGTIGFLNWGQDLRSGANAPMPSLDAPNAVICPFWDDIDSEVTPARIYGVVDGTAPKRTATITWENVRPREDPTSRVFFQVLIRESSSPSNDNDIAFQYLDVDENNLTVGAGRSATVGVEDEYGALSRSYSFNGENLLRNRLALLLSRDPPAPDTTAPVGSIRFLESSASSVTFEVGFDEVVSGLTASNIVVGGTAPGAFVASLTGGGVVYRGSVEGISDYGSIELSIPAGACADLDKNANDAIGPAIYCMPYTTVLFADDMDGGPGDWVTSTETAGSYTSKGWEWGQPTNGGPAGANSGLYCRGTVLNGTYSNYMNAWVVSPPVQVGDNPTVSFSLWHGLVSERDYGYVEVSAHGPWINVTPGGYYTGSSAGWLHETIQIDNALFGNSEIRVRFRLQSDYTGRLYGMYIDDFQVASRKPAGVWVTAYTPTNCAAGSATSVTFTAYNSSTTTHEGVAARISSPNSGVTLTGNSVVVYGDLSAGQKVTSVAPADIALGAADEFASSSVQLFHSVTSLTGFVSQQGLPLTVSGLGDFVFTNVVIASCTEGVFDWIERPLPGDGGPESALLQLIYSGADGIPDPPLANGRTTGDDVALCAVRDLGPYGRFGEGSTIPPDLGRFQQRFYHGLVAGSMLYVRAWDGASFEGSVGYGDSQLRALTGAGEQSLVFAAWTVATAVDVNGDWDADSIPDGYAIDHGMDAKDLVEPLATDWTPLGAAGTGGSGPLEMRYPGRVVAITNLVFVADTQNNRLQVWDTDLATLLDSYGSGGSGDDELLWPHGLALLSASNILVVADTDNDRLVVLEFDPTDGDLTLLRSIGTNGVGDGQFNSPHAVAVADDGTVYVADTDNHRVQILSLDGAYIDDFGSFGTGAGFFSSPKGICVDAAGKVYVADTGNNRVQIFQADGTFDSQFNGTGSPAGTLNKPFDVQTGWGGRIYITETAAHRVRVFSSAFVQLGAFKPPAGQAGPEPGQLRFPEGAFPSSWASEIYVADTWNHRVQRLALVMDSDGDGMDDVWEDAHGLNSGNPNDAWNDDDADGLLNIGEYRLDFDPWVEDTNDVVWAGVPRSRDVVIQGVSVHADRSPLRFDGDNFSEVELSWDARESERFQVEHTHDLNNGAWVEDEVLHAEEDGLLMWSQAMPTNAAHFYRVRRLDP